MSKTKHERTIKKQLGQFMTPMELTRNIINEIQFIISDKVLEPSFGDGNFIIPLIDKFLPLYDDFFTINEKLDIILSENIYGVEYDMSLYHKTLQRIKEKYNYLPEKHNFFNNDYFEENFTVNFDYIIGNPPFGGSIRKEIDNMVEKKYGMRNKIKIKKETYCMFIIKSLDNLKKNGELLFISSNTFLTINTMKGLRNHLMLNGVNEINHLHFFSEETSYSMVILKHKNIEPITYIKVDDKKIHYSNINKTENLSWQINDVLSKYFSGDTLSKYIKTSSGMTVGKNEYFIKKIKNNSITENYSYEFFNDYITVEKELSKSRLNKLSDRKIEEIKLQEINREFNRNIKIAKKETHEIIQLPHSDYCFYNKATSDIIYSHPTSVIYWKDDGDAVYTFKKNGNWYLHGVGGKPFFKMEGITWRLISDRILMRYLDEGYILDSGSPIGVLKPGIDKDELFFILAWTISDLCNDILKNVINHTTNIQSKDIERLPYPYWVNNDDKTFIVSKMKQYINNIKNGKDIDKNTVMMEINKVFSY